MAQHHPLDGRLLKNRLIFPYAEMGEPPLRTIPALTRFYAEQEVNDSVFSKLGAFRVKFDKRLDE